MLAMVTNEKTMVMRFTAGRAAPVPRPSSVQAPLVRNWKSAQLPGTVHVPGTPGFVTSAAPSKPPPLTNYAKGPVGMLQWLAATYPQIFAHIQKTHPEVLQQATDLQSRMFPACPTCTGGGLKGLGDLLSDVSSWGSTIMNYANQAASLYTSVESVKNGINSNTLAQVQQAQAGQAPLAYPSQATGAAPATTPPPAAAVTSAASMFSGSTGLLIVGAGIVGLIGFAVVKSSKSKATRG